MCDVYVIYHIYAALIFGLTTKYGLIDQLAKLSACLQPVSI